MTIPFHPNSESLLRQPLQYTVHTSQTAYGGLKGHTLGAHAQSSIHPVDTTCKQVQVAVDGDTTCSTPCARLAAAFHTGYSLPFPQSTPSEGPPPAIFSVQDGRRTVLLPPYCWHYRSLASLSLTLQLCVMKLSFAPQALLASPELDGGCVLNLGAASLLRSAPHAYRQMVLDCVTASLRVDGKVDGWWSYTQREDELLDRVCVCDHPFSLSQAGLQPYEAVEAQTESRAAGDVSLPSTPASPGMQRLRSSRRRRRRSQLAKPISFDDYHTLWKGIATSVTTYRQPNICKSHIGVNSGGSLCLI